MKFAAPLLLLLAAGSSFSQARAAAEKRLTGLEKRVTRVEKRVTRLEAGGPAAASAAAVRQKRPASPIAVYFIKKKQVVGREKLGMKFYLEFENVSNRRYDAFNGVLVFRDEAGGVIWTKAYGYSDPLLPGEKAQATLLVSSNQTKEYLKLLRARAITVSLEKQDAYGAD